MFYVSLSTGNVLDMYKSIAWELGLPGERSRATAYRAIRGEITRLVQEAKLLPVLVVDEAQFLRNDVLHRAEQTGAHLDQQRAEAHTVAAEPVAPAGSQPLAAAGEARVGGEALGAAAGDPRRRAGRPRVA